LCRGIAEIGRCICGCCRLEQLKSSDGSKSDAAKGLAIIALAVPKNRSNDQAIKIVDSDTLKIGNLEAPSGGGDVPEPVCNGVRFLVGHGLVGPSDDISLDWPDSKKELILTVGFHAGCMT